MSVAADGDLTPLVRRADLGDQAGEPARRGDDQSPPRAAAGHVHGVGRAGGDGQVVAGRSTALLPPVQTVNSPSST